MKKQIFFYLLLFVCGNISAQQTARDSLIRPKSSIKAEYRFSRIERTGRFDQSFNAHRLRIDAWGNFLQIDTDPLNLITVGRYQRILYKNDVGVLRPHVSLRYEGDGGSVGLSYTHWWKHKAIPTLALTRYWAGRPNDLTGADVYIINPRIRYGISDYKTITFDIYQDLSVLENSVVGIKYQQAFGKKKYQTLTLGALGGTQGTYGFNANYKYRGAFIFGTYNKNIDFSGLDQSQIGIGYQYRHK